jgi:hypothetical protein
VKRKSGSRYQRDPGTKSNNLRAVKCLQDWENDEKGREEGNDKFAKKVTVD